MRCGRAPVWEFSGFGLRISFGYLISNFGVRVQLVLGSDELEFDPGCSLVHGGQGFVSTGSGGPYNHKIIAPRFVSPIHAPTKPVAKVWGGAGRELIDEGGKTRSGGWIRPVSNHDEGAIDLAERRLPGAVDPKPLGAIQIPLSASENSPLQPENWLIEPGHAWMKKSSMEALVLPALLEQPENLWFDPSKKSDRASAFAEPLDAVALN